MESQNHIYLPVPDYGYWVDDGVVEEPYYIIVGFICGLGLYQGEVDQGNQHGGIHRLDIVQKRDHKFAHHGDAFQW